MNLEIRAKIEKRPGKQMFCVRDFQSGTLKRKGCLFHERGIYCRKRLLSRSHLIEESVGKNHQWTEGHCSGQLSKIGAIIALLSKKAELVFFCAVTC